MEVRTIRVWDCDPRLLCDKHLTKQHAEIHFAINVIDNGWRTKWKDVGRFRRHPLGVGWLSFVHDATVIAIQERKPSFKHGTPLVVPERFSALLLRWQDRDHLEAEDWLETLVERGYPPTELKQGTPWERDHVSFEWYRANEKTYSREAARLENLRLNTIGAA